MANRSLFASILGKILPRTNAVNEAGGRAYARTPRQALAQYAATGCLNGTFYATAAEQLDRVIGFADAVEPEFLARTALHLRRRGRMKDMPALLCALLSKRDVALLDRIFDRVIDDGKMLRNFVQIVRSGAARRKSFGSAPKRMIRRWFERRDPREIFRAAIGGDPSLGDILKMVHPRPRNLERAGLYGYLVGRTMDRALLPPEVRALEAFRTGASLEVPDVPFQRLAGLPLSKHDWATVARRASWTTLRMNLQTFARHGVFEIPGMADVVATRLADPETLTRARPFPYQILAARAMADERIPEDVRAALDLALESALGNVPTFAGDVHLCVDVSGSMESPLTGNRRGSTTVVTCVDVAALTAVAILRKNPRARVLPFADSVRSWRFDPTAPFLRATASLAACLGGGTNASAPLRLLNGERARGDLVIYVSDNQSWMDVRTEPGTAMLREWQTFRARNRDARLVCLDLQPGSTVQAPDRDDILNVGGFSDAVFEVIDLFARGTLAPEHWISVIESEPLDDLT